MTNKTPYKIKPQERGHRPRIGGEEETKKLTLYLKKTAYQWAFKKGQKWWRDLIDYMMISNLTIK